MKKAIYEVTNDREFDILAEYLDEEEARWFAGQRPAEFRPRVEYPFYIHEYDKGHITYSKDVSLPDNVDDIISLEDIPAKGDVAIITDTGIFCGSVKRGDRFRVTKVTPYMIDLDNGILTQCVLVKHWKEYIRTQSQPSAVINGNKTTLNINGRSYSVTCHEDDVFDAEKGVLLCLAKAHGYSYKDILAMLPKQKEIRRRAKVGEYIKLTTKSFTFNEIGDILRVSRADDNCSCVQVKGYDHPRDTLSNPNEEWSYTPREYVVLADYKPTYKITINEFFTGRPKAIHCDTEHKAKLLLDAFNRHGYRWRDNDRYTEKTMWEEYGKNTIYDNDHGFCDIGGRWYNLNNPIIYEFEDVDLK